MDKRQMIPAAGLIATVLAAAYMVVQLNGQAAAPTADLTNAALAEVRNAEGQVILSGHFQLVEEDDDDVERNATLAPTGVVPDATGEAEVEFSKSAAECIALESRADFMLDARRGGEQVETFLGKSV